MTFDDFAARDLPALLRFAKVLCVDRGTAEDVLQEVLFRAHQQWDRVGVLDDPPSYVRKMIVNEYLSWRRKWARIVPTVVLPEAVTTDPAAAVADRLQLAGAMARLPRRQRAVVTLRYFAGLTDVEIAHTLGCSHGTVRSHASHALRTLRVDLVDLEEKDDERSPH